MCLGPNNSRTRLLPVDIPSWNAEYWTAISYFFLFILSLIYSFLDLNCRRWFYSIPELFITPIHYRDTGDLDPGHYPVLRRIIAIIMSNIPLSFSLDHLRHALPSMPSLMSWKALALVLAVINLKNLPFVWHVSYPNPLLKYILYKQTNPS